MKDTFIPLKQRKTNPPNRGNGELIPADDHLAQDAQQASARDRSFGAAINQDRIALGHVQGIGSVWLEAVVDVANQEAFGRLQSSPPSPSTAVHMLETEVLPYYDTHGTMVQAIITDADRDFRTPLYQEYLARYGIDHQFSPGYERSGQLRSFLRAAARFCQYNAKNSSSSSLDDLLLIFATWMQDYNNRKR